jgi:hypothetical protein
MKLPLFVTTSAAVLAVWLGATYMQAVPVKTYPQLGRGSVPIAAVQTPAPSQAVAAQAVKKPSHLLARTAAPAVQDASGDR